MDQRILDLPVKFGKNKYGSIIYTPEVTLKTKDGKFKGRFESSESFSRREVNEFAIHTVEDFFAEVQNIGICFTDLDYDPNEDITEFKYRGMDKLTDVIAG